MLTRKGSVGFLAYVSQVIRKQDGQCPTYSAPDRCANSFAELMARKDQGKEGPAGVTGS